MKHGSPSVERLPDLQVVIDHMADCPLGQPEKLHLLTTLARYPSVFVKLSHMWSLSAQPYPYPDAARQVIRIYSSFGACRLMWGTDWPICLKQLSYSDAVNLFRSHLGFIPLTIANKSFTKPPSAYGHLQTSDP